MSMTIGEGDLRSDRITVVVEEDLRELIPGYLENRRKDITTIREALAGSDYETIRSLGHKMKGSAAAMVSMPSPSWVMTSKRRRKANMPKRFPG